MPRYRNYVPWITGRFQSSRLVTTFPTQWHARHNIPYVTANLIALRDPMPRNGGAYFWLPRQGPACRWPERGISAAWLGLTRS